MVRTHSFSKAPSGVADGAAEQVHGGLAASRHTFPVRLREELLGISVAVSRTSIATFPRRRVFFCLHPCRRDCTSSGLAERC